MAVDDLATLETLDEPSLLAEIKLRYDDKIIYTYIGDILIAMNPYQPLPIYDVQIQQRYSNIQARHELPPHIYAVSDNAYQSMISCKENQCCVVSGESGAGKTETTKLMVQHIAELCKSTTANLHEKIIQVNPLLEAFGNAQTVINNNSSRFGKFIDIQFSPMGKILGAHISEYLLEKSRVVSQGPGERNFHIFYYLFAGLDPIKLESNLLITPENHRIMKRSDGLPAFKSAEDREEHKATWDQLLDIMHTVGFRHNYIDSIHATLAAILHLTDIEFLPDTDTDGVFIPDESSLKMAATLLGVSEAELANALISDTTKIRGTGETLVMLKNVHQANDGRDALAKALYGRLFGWIVRKVNSLIMADPMEDRGQSIGILDLAGFENFGTNSFEQLCINAANEQLQYYFNQHIFQWELNEYREEGVRSSDIQFSNNAPTVSMLITDKLSLFSLLDEESHFPSATDSTLLEKLSKNCGKDKKYFTIPRGKKAIFSIQHYAGAVYYTVTNFLEKNRDTLSPSIVSCMQASETQLIVGLFCATLSDTGAFQPCSDAPKRSRQSVLMVKQPNFSLTRNKSFSKDAAKQIKLKGGKKAERAAGDSLNKTMGSHFKSSLTELMAKVDVAHPIFIRCIKPNSSKEPDFFQDDLVMQQLRYTGVLETVKIRRQGFATRLFFDVFLDRYKFVAFPLWKSVEPTAENCAIVLKKIQIQGYELGKTKVFLKYWHTEQLQASLTQASASLIKCQSVVRRFVARRQYLRLQAKVKEERRKVEEFCSKVEAQAAALYAALDNTHKWDLEQHKQKVIEQEKVIKDAQDKLRRPTQNRAPRDRASRAAMVVAPGMEEEIRQSLYASNLGNNTNGNAGSTPPLPHRGISTYATHIQVQKSPVPTPRETTSSSPIPPRMPIQKRTDPNKKSAFRRVQENILYEELKDSLIKYPHLSAQIWAKLLYWERGELVGKVYLREWDVTVDGSDRQYDGKSIGLNNTAHFLNPERDREVNAVLSRVGQGVQLTRDNVGNIYITQLGSCDITVKGYDAPDRHCVSNDAVQRLGKLQPGKPCKMFDMSKFDEHLRKELLKPTINKDRMESLSMIRFSFGPNCLDDFDTPCWAVLINFCSMDRLGEDQVFHDLMNFGSTSASTPPPISAKEQKAKFRTWRGLHRPRVNSTASTYNPLPLQVPSNNRPITASVPPPSGMHLNSPTAQNGNHSNTTPPPLPLKQRNKKP